MSLQKASEFLKNALNQIETELEKTQNDAKPSTSAGPSTSACPSTWAGPSTSTQLSHTAQDNFRRAFPGLCSRETKRPYLSNNRKSTPTRNSMGASRSLIPFVPKETWTHDFYTLSSTTQLFSPGREESDTLLSAGLGRRKLVCPNKNASHSEFQKFLESEFPRLKAGGGFELLRAVGGGGGKRRLQAIPPGPEGYNIPYIRGVIGSGVVFIRPLQANLDNSRLLFDATNPKSPKIECMHCGKSFGIQELKVHVKDCSQASTSSATTSSSPDPLNTDDVMMLPKPGNEVIKIPEEKHESLQNMDIETIKKILPSVNEGDIKITLIACGGDKNAAVATLLGSDEDDKDDVNFDEVLMKSSLDFEETPTEILENYQDKIQSKGPLYQITFNRSKKVLTEAIRIYKSKHIKLDRPPVVYFVSEDEEGQIIEEDAADVGGPKKEFFYLILQGLLSSTSPHIFEGALDHKIPVHSQQAVLQEIYLMTGKAIAHAAIHGCVPTVGLAKPLKEYVVSGCPEAASKMVTIDDIPDPSIRKIVEDIGNADSNLLDELNSEEEVQSLINQSGCSQAIITTNNKNVVAFEIMVYIVIFKRVREMEQLRQGIDSLSLCTLLRKYRSMVQIFFPTEAESVISIDVLKKILNSEPQTDDDKNTLQFFIRYLEEVSKRKEGVNLKRVMIFITSSTRPDFIEIIFNNKPNALPDPDTCLGKLNLTNTTKSYEKFRSDFDSVVSVQGEGFGRS